MSIYKYSLSNQYSKTKQMKKNLNVLLLISVIGILFSCVKMPDDTPISKTKVLAISIDPDHVSMEVNKTIQLNATVVPKDIKEPILWSSLAADIATVSPEGVVTSLKEGETIITAKIGDKSCTARITVKNIVPVPANYCVPDASFKRYAVISEIVLNDTKLEGRDDGFYSDLTDKIINITSSESKLTVEVDQAETTTNDKFILVAYIDWNGDGDFKDVNEEIFMENWDANGKKKFEAKISVPKDAKTSSRVRIAFYFDGGNTDMTHGCGTMDSGDVKDFMYKITF